MKLLVCATEYYPHGFGIANVAHRVVEQLEGQGDPMHGLLAERHRDHYREPAPDSATSRLAG